MAGSGKGKNPKKKGRSNRSKPTTTNKQHGTSNLSPVEGEKLIKQKDGTKGPEVKSSSSKLKRCIHHPEDGPEMRLYLKLEQQYHLALEKLLSLNYPMEVVMMALLKNGSIFGNSSTILENLVTNCISAINSTNDARHPIFEDMTQVRTFSVQSLINLVTEIYPQMTISDAVAHILSDKSIFRSEAPAECSGSKDEPKGDAKRLLEERTSILSRLNINYSVPFHDNSDKGVRPLVDPKDHSALDGLNIEEWLANSPEDQKNKMMVELANYVDFLEAKLESTKEWAQGSVVKTAERLPNDVMEKNKLKQKKLGKEKLSKAKVEQIEDGLRIDNDFLPLFRKLKNAEMQRAAYKADISASELIISEEGKALKLARKKENKSRKKLEAAEKRMSALQSCLEQEKKDIEEAKENLAQMVEAEKQTQLRLWQESEAKKQAEAFRLEQERLVKKTKEATKKHLASVKNELDEKKQHNLDEVHRLEKELSDLKNSSTKTPTSAPTSTLASVGSNSEAAAAPPKFKRRLCLICRETDVCIVFLPCSHEVLCAQCDQEVYESLENQCPCCYSKIERKIKVYGPMN